MANFHKKWNIRKVTTWTIFDRSSKFLKFWACLILLIKMSTNMTYLSLQIKKLIFLLARAQTTTFDPFERGLKLILKIPKNHIVIRTGNLTRKNLGSITFQKKCFFATPYPTTTIFFMVTYSQTMMMTKIVNWNYLAIPG